MWSDILYLSYYWNSFSFYYPKLFSSAIPEIWQATILSYAIILLFWVLFFLRQPSKTLAYNHLLYFKTLFENLGVILNPNHTQCMNHIRLPLHQLMFKLMLLIVPSGVSILNNSKWRGNLLKIEMAKENFLTRSAYTYLKNS